MAESGASVGVSGAAEPAVLHYLSPPPEERLRLWRQWHVALGMDGSVMHDDMDAFLILPKEPIQLIKIDYVHGYNAIYGCTMCQDNPHQGDYTTDVLVSCTKGYVAQRLIHLVRHCKAFLSSKAASPRPVPKMRWAMKARAKQRPSPRGMQTGSKSPVDGAGDPVAGKRPHSATLLWLRERQLCPWDQNKGSRNDIRAKTYLEGSSMRREEYACNLWRRAEPSGTFREDQASMSRAEKDPVTWFNSLCASQQQTLMAIVRRTAESRRLDGGAGVLPVVGKRHCEVLQQRRC